LLSFDSALSDSLKLSNTTSFWVLKLYYNDETNFIGVSEQDRQDGSDMYYGLVSSWGAYSQSLDFFNFTTSVGNMSVRLINTDMSFKGGRFSDDFATNNYANRKWELFQNTSGTSTYDTSARMIASGIISGDIKYDQHSISLTLLDKGSTYHKQLPTNVVDSTTYPNAPEKNIGKPIPMAYGDFHEDTFDGTLPTSHFDKYKYFYLGAFPAIVTNKWDTGSETQEASLDSVALHTIDDENIYFYKDGYYPTFTGTISSSNNPIVQYQGSGASVYIPLTNEGQGSATGDGNVTQPQRLVDRDFDLPTSWSTNYGKEKSVTLPYSVPLVNKLGKYTGISIITRWGTSNLGVADNGSFTWETAYGNASDGNIPSDTISKNNISSLFENTDSWEFEGNIDFELSNGSDFGGFSVAAYEAGLVIDFDIEDIESHKVQELYEATFVGGISLNAQFGAESEGFSTTRILTRTKTILTPSEIDYIYFSGKGRKYGTWINSRSTGYNTTLAIENPIFIIEEILRTELGLSSATIDESTFNTSGQQTGGYLGDIYDDDTDDVKFAFSQYKFINSKDLINRICKQILSWVYISGDGKFKIKTLKRSYSSSDSDKTIDYTDINLKSISKTSLGGVRNDISINYNHDYGQDQFLSNVNPTADATSEGTGVDGYNQTLKLEMDADTLDSTTATQLADAYQTIFKDRKIIIDFDCKRPKYNDLEIGDIIDFSNWDSKIKLYGTAMSGYFLISSIQKRVDGCSIKVIKV